MANIQKKYIGILGGSFDPAHKGHLGISKIAIKKFKLKKIYWVITKKNPFKKKTFYSLRDIASLDKGFLDNFLSNKSIRALAFGSFDNISLRTQAEFLVIFKLIQRTN